MKPFAKYGLVLGIAALVVLSVFPLLRVLPVKAQQSQSVPGSPSATESLDTRYLPPPPSKFGGVINLSATQSRPWWPPRVTPP
jgi:arylsulfatase